MGTKLIGPILKSLQVKYKAPVTFPDYLFLGTAVTQVEPDRFTMKHILVSSKLERIACEGEGVVVSFDYIHRKKAAATPQLIQTMLDIYQAAYPGAEHHTHSTPAKAHLESTSNPHSHPHSHSHSQAAGSKQ